jgi:hypothetical protein
MWTTHRHRLRPWWDRHRQRRFHAQDCRVSVSFRQGRRRELLLHGFSTATDSRCRRRRHTTSAKHHLPWRIQTVPGTWSTRRRVWSW